MVVPETLYLLLDRRSGRVHGIYRDGLSLCSMYSNLKSLAPHVSFEARRLIIGSNMAVEVLADEALEEMGEGYLMTKGPGSAAPTSAPIVDANGETCVKIPIETRSEVVKVKEKYSVFTENMRTFRRLLDGGVIDLGMDASAVPELFRDKFDIFRDIVSHDVPDEHAFGYFMDRYVPNQRGGAAFVLETVNEVSSDDSEGVTEELSDDDDDESGEETDKESE